MQPDYSKNPIVKIKHQKEVFDQTVIVNWCLGSTCNFSCTYCPEYLHDGKKPWIDFPVVKNFCSKVVDHYKYKNKHRLFFEFTGGEVSLYKDFIPLIKFIRSHDCLVSMISNGSRRMAYWEKARPYLNHICLSFHPESADPDHFKKVVQFLNETVSVHVNVMMLPEKFEICQEMARWVGKETKNVTLAVQPLLIEFGSELYNYTEEQRQFIENPGILTQIEAEPVKYRGALIAVHKDGSEKVTTGQQLIAAGQNHWKGWDCFVGIKQIVVDFDGQVLRGWCQVGGKIGDIRKPEKIKFPTSPILCNKDFCHCVLDVMNKRELKTESKSNSQSWIRDFKDKLFAKDNVEQL